VPLPHCAFSGWLDASYGGPASAPDVVESTTKARRLLATAPGFCFEFDPTRVRFHPAADTFTAWTGAPLDSKSGRRLEPAEVAGAAIALLDGEDAPQGRFSIVHADLAGRKLLLVTDRFAIFPLCFAKEVGRIRISDRSDSVDPSDASRLDLQAIYDYLYFHVIPAPRTIHRGVTRLEGAQAAILSAEDEVLQTTWRPVFSPTSQGSFRKRKDQFLDIIGRAVEAESSSASVGAYLSGGTDSSTVCGFLTRLHGPSIPTFSIGFDVQGYDEMAYAQIAARHFGCQHFAYYVTPDDLVRAIPLVARSYDQPFGNSSAVPAYYCAVLARTHGVDRLLAGDGGDELFGGNVRYAKQKAFDFYWRVPSALRAALLDPLARTPGARRIPLLSKLSSYVAQARQPMPDRMESYNLLRRIGAEALLTSAFLSRVRTDLPAQLQSHVYQRFARNSLIDSMLAYDWRFTLTDNDLPKVRGTASLAGVDASFPLLNDELVDFSLTLSPKDKVRGLALRHFFKAALADFLPPEILRKRKHGFGLPFGPWLLESPTLRSLAQHSVKQLVRRNLINETAASSLFSEKLSEHAGYYGELIWVLMMLEQWLDAHAPGFRID
jgi:asparagine synthase (glutamine-hydrolysing)